MPHSELAAGDGVTLYRDTNAWCPFCERVWLALLEKGIEHETQFIDLRSKPDWYKDIVPTGQTPSAVIDGQVVYESLDILLAIEERGEGTPLLPSEASDRERVLQELRDFDGDGGIGVGGAGYIFSALSPTGAFAHRRPRPPHYSSGRLALVSWRRQDAPCSPHRRSLDTPLAHASSTRL